jgi:glycerophosphoryl diester phosphodiesterase
VPLIIEIKSDFSGNLQLAHRVIEIVKRTDAPIAVKSFDPAVITEIRRHAPEIPRGIIGMDEIKYEEYPTLTQTERHALANLLHFTDTAPHFISWDVKALPSAAPFLCRAALGLPVMSWTVRSAADREVAAAHADQIVFEGFLPQP